MKKEYELIGKENGMTISCRVFKTEQNAELSTGETELASVEPSVFKPEMPSDHKSIDKSGLLV